MSEAKLYAVSREWAERAYIDAEKYREMYRRSVDDPDGFWAEQAKRIDWIKPFTKVKNTSYDYPDVSIKWFEDGTLNISANCIDRHLKDRADQVAILWEGDDPAERQARSPTASSHAHVCRLANVLKARGVKKGDRVTIYMPMIPEAAYAMLACARIGAVHSVVFGGFSPELAGEPHRGLPLRFRHHRRRGPARRQADPAEGQHRQGDRARRARRRACAPRAGDASAPAARCTWSATATSGTTRRSQRSRRTARPSRWTPRTRSSSSTRRARPASRRACSTRPAAISSMCR